MKASRTRRPRLRPRRAVEPDLDANNFKVDHPEQFPLATAVEYKAAPALECDGRGAARYSPRGAGDFAGRGASGGSESAAGRCGEKRPVAAESAEQRCFRSVPDYRKAVNDEAAGAVQLERQQTSLRQGRGRQERPGAGGRCGQECAGRSGRGHRTVADCSASIRIIRRELSTSAARSRA